MAHRMGWLDDALTQTLGQSSLLATSSGDVSAPLNASHQRQNYQLFPQSQQLHEVNQRGQQKYHQQNLQQPQTLAQIWGNIDILHNQLQHSVQLQNPQPASQAGVLQVSGR